MKKTTMVLGLTILVTMAALTTQAQSQGGGSFPPGPPPNGGGMRYGPGGTNRPAPPNATNLVAKFDTNGDGNLDATELATALDSIHPPRPPSSPDGATTDNRPEPPSGAEMAAQWIQQFDADGSGSLSVDELAKAFESRKSPNGNGPPGPLPGGPSQGTDMP